MSHQLEQAVDNYRKVQKAERAFAKANHELNRSLILLPSSELDEYYRRTTELNTYDEHTFRMYP